MKGRKQVLHRQGDVVLREVEAMPRTARRAEDGVLAHGEATGHAHRVVGDGAVFRDPQSQRTYVKVMTSAKLIHEEHRPITIQQGVYEVILRRQYSPLGERRTSEVSHLMDRQLTFRIPDTLAIRLDRAAREMRRKRSELVRLALEEFLEGPGTRPPVRPVDLVRDLMGSMDSGLSDLGQRHREYLISRLRRGRPTRP